MPDLAALLPIRRANLVSWPAGNNGQHFVRNRASGDSFQLGNEEHFLLECLDGSHCSDQITHAFQERFGQSLSAEELKEFVQLAADRGLLQSGTTRVGADSTTLGPLESATTAPATLRGSQTLFNRLASRSLESVSTALRWPARILSAAAARLDMLRLRHLEFVPRPDDIFIVTYPRSGTTWMQMILYQLTTDGEMDFPHIGEYCPWFERSVRSARGFELRPSPRLFKSHMPYAKIPKGPCKYIYVARDGKDVAVSCYHLVRAYNGYEGTFSDFFDAFLRGKFEFGSWFSHVQAWWAHRHDPNVLFLTYEALSHDLPGCVRRIAAFIGRQLPPERLHAVLKRSSFAFMKEHEQKFDPAMESLWEQGVQLKSFLRDGKVGDGAVCLTDDQRDRFTEVFQRHLAALDIPWDTQDRSAQA